MGALLIVSAQSADGTRIARRSRPRASDQRTAWTLRRRPESARAPRVRQCAQPATWKHDAGRMCPPSSTLIGCRTAPMRPNQAEYDDHQSPSIWIMRMIAPWTRNPSLAIHRFSRVRFPATAILIVEVNPMPPNRDHHPAHRHSRNCHTNQADDPRTRAARFAQQLDCFAHT